MALDSALSIATGGLANINAQFQIISQNVANAATPGYAAEVGTQQSLSADGVGFGVRTGPATLNVDRALQSSITQQNAVVAGLQTTQTSLQALDSVQGAPGSGMDLASLLGNLSDSFSALLTDPSNQVQQSAVVSSATSLAHGINAISNAYAAQRQNAQDDVTSAVKTLNSALATVGNLSDQIITLRAAGRSAADLENQRNAAVQTLSQLVDIRTAEQRGGDLSIFTSNGLILPTHSATDVFSINNAATPAGSYYPGGGLPGILMGTEDVTNQLSGGGQIGADLTLRDVTIPTYQAELDEFSEGLSSRFASQGLTLFTDPSGKVPSSTGAPTQSGYVGYASIVQVNPAVAANPSLVRDGTNSVAATGFTPNPPTGPAGFTSLISNIINFAFGTQASPGVAQPPLNTLGLGASGTLTASFNGAGGALSDYATSLVASQGKQSADTTAALTNEQALQNSLSSKASSVNGVNMDTEMAHMLSLQSAYSANARVIAAVRSMFSELLQVVQ